MITPRSPASQRGVATIFIAMVLLILITLMVVTAFSLSTMNLKAVGNVQTRNEALAAADKSLELAIDQTFWNPIVERDYEIDIDRDSVPDYQVNVSAPTCIRATEANIISASSVTLPGFSAVSGWNTIWEMEAVATNAALGTRVRVRQGVRVLMTEADKELYCGS